MEFSQKKELIRPDCPEPIDIEIEDSESYSVEDEHFVELKNISSYNLNPILIKKNENKESIKGKQ